MPRTHIFSCLTHLTLHIGLDPEMTVEAFLHLLQQQLALPHKHMSIRAGFPPKAITMPSDPTGATLASLQVCRFVVHVVHAIITCSQCHTDWQW